MKTLIKITALAAIMAFAVSCGPEAALSGIDWKTVNAGNDTKKNSDDIGHIPFEVFLSDLGITDEIVLQFDKDADVLKSKLADTEAVLREFLSFHHYSVVDLPGKADELGADLAYDYITRSGQNITVKLTTSFTGSSSNLIIKIDGTKYTFGNGNKMDRANRGIGGEAIYDDYYAERTITNDSVFPLLYFPPGNKDWSLDLPKGNVTYSDEITKTLGNTIIATPNLPDRIDLAMSIPVAEELKTGLRIEQLENGVWTTVNATFAVTEVGDRAAIIVHSVTYREFIPLRIVWEGNAPFITTGDYFGVKQWIRINGENTPSTSSLAYQMKKVYGGARVWYNTYGLGAVVDASRFGMTIPANRVSLYSMDSLEQNVVIELGPFPDRADGGTSYWLKEITDEKLFKDNFKIAYTTSSAPSFQKNSSVVYIPIKKFEFVKIKEDAGGLDGIRITLDPKYMVNDYPKYFYISDKIGLSDNKTTFGSAENWQYGFFKAYGPFSGEF
jgi:hypothetical protein